MHTADYREFFAWAFGAMVVQMLAYAITTRC
jgi:putative membrane protein